MGCVLVGRGRGLVAVNFDEDETRGLILLLNDVESGDAWFLHALLGVFDCGMAKSLDRSGLHVDMDMNDEHSFLLLIKCSEE